jgi:hypothetical protein
MRMPGCLADVCSLDALANFASIGYVNTGRRAQPVIAWLRLKVPTDGENHVLCGA